MLDPVAEALSRPVACLRTWSATKNQILHAFNDGMAPRPGTTFGTVNADVLDRFTPGYQRANFVDIIQNNDWPE